MTGKELFKHYTSKRDYTGSEADEYAQTLLSIFTILQAEIYPLLEKAENEGKKLTIQENTTDFLFVDDFEVILA